MLKVSVKSIVSENLHNELLNSEISFRKTIFIHFFFKQLLIFSKKKILLLEKIFYFCRARRDGRVVDRGGLENR